LHPIWSDTKSGTRHSAEGKLRQQLVEGKEDLRQTKKHSLKREFLFKIQMDENKKL
jgi:hypothetical protein